VQVAGDVDVRWTITARTAADVESWNEPDAEADVMASSVKAEVESTAPEGPQTPVSRVMFKLPRADHRSYDYYWKERFCYGSHVASRPELLLRYTAAKV